LRINTASLWFLFKWFPSVERSNATIRSDYCVSAGCATHPAEALLLAGDAGEVNARSNQRADDVDVERHAELVDRVRNLVVVRSEVFVGEALTDQHSLVAVVQEARVVGAALDRVVVRVDRLQVETVLGDSADDCDRQHVAAVLVDVVVDVEHVFGRAAVADHVALDHAHDVVLGCSASIGVLDAAPETLLFAGEVQEADFDVVRDDQAVEGLGNLEDGNRARTIIIGARCDLFVAPGVAGGRIEVRTVDVHALFRARHLACDLGFEVEVGLAADGVGNPSGGDGQRAVELLEPGHCQVDAFAMRAAALEDDALVTDIDSLFARETSDKVGELIGTNAGKQLLDEGFAGRQVGDVDRVDLLVHGPANFFARELAGTVFAVAVNVNLSAVDGMEVSLERNDRLTSNFVLRTEVANDKKNNHANKRGGDEISKHGIFLSLGQSASRVSWPVSDICCKDSAEARCGKARIPKAGTSSQLTVVG